MNIIFLLIIKLILPDTKYIPTMVDGHLEYYGVVSVTIRLI